MLLAGFTVLTLERMVVKTLVVEIAAALAQIKTVVANWLCDHMFYCQALTKKKPISNKSVLGKAAKIMKLNIIKSWPLSTHLKKYFSWQRGKWKYAQSPVTAYWSILICLVLKQLCDCLRYKLKWLVFHEIPFLLEGMSGKLYFHLVYLVDVFLKIDKTIVATDKIRAFKQNLELEFWETFIFLLSPWTLSRIKT